ncbi:unnamed protein product [Acanthoscelides obtectus]|uniref:Uncharacterized protein n=1 Tax=Acanthoscelides obtectus TaxID=200917 RepID=A0A9P0M3C7_ACAOB|nr:unnamed protein product [Acanthoscelides obtectus]CAK1649756.1 hypothetical protein AOBTE_LOCUS16405 [Acanthoscelides obtectus]
MASKPIKKYLLFTSFFRYSSVIFPIKIRFISRHTRFCSILVTTLRSCDKVCYFFTIRRVHFLSGAANRIVIRLRRKHLEVCTSPAKHQQNLRDSSELYQSNAYQFERY